MSIDDVLAENDKQMDKSHKSTHSKSAVSGVSAGVNNKSNTHSHGGFVNSSGQNLRMNVSIEKVHCQKTTRSDLTNKSHQKNKKKDSTDS